MSIPQDEQESYDRDYASMCQLGNYALKNAVVHFIEGGKQERFYTLLVKNKAWMDAKQKRFGSAQRFISDVERALQANWKPLQLIELEAAHRVAEYSVSVYEDTAIETLVWLGNLQEALAAARRLDREDDPDSQESVNPDQSGNSVGSLDLSDHPQEIHYPHAYSHTVSRVEVLLIIERAARESHTLLETNALFAEIEREIFTIPDLKQRYRSLIKLAEAYALNQFFDKALELCYSMEYTLFRIDGLGKVGVLLHKAGDQRYTEIFRQVGQAVQKNARRGSFWTTLSSTVPSRRSACRNLANFGSGILGGNHC
jgi:hypothetical protein